MLNISLKEGWNRIKWSDSYYEDLEIEIIESSSEPGIFVH
jgi:hypothetical protein